MSIIKFMKQKQIKFPIVTYDCPTFIIKRATKEFSNNNKIDVVSASCSWRI